jgi:hypothetical protein
MRGERDYIKIIKDADIEIGWIYYSSVSPEFIIVTDAIDKKQEEIIICKASNIADVYLKTNEICLDFYGRPREYDRPTFIPDSFSHYAITIDTTSVLKKWEVRKTFILKNKGTFKEKFLSLPIDAENF